MKPREKAAGRRCVDARRLFLRMVALVCALLMLGSVLLAAFG